MEERGQKVKEKATGNQCRVLTFTLWVAFVEFAGTQ